MWPDGEIFGTICVLDNKENHYDNKCVKLLELLRNSIQKDLQLALDERMLEAKIKYIQATENKLRESEIKYRELFNNMRSAVIIYNVKNGGKNFIFEDLNKAAESIEKINKVDVIGKNFKKIFPKGLNTDLFKIMKHVWRTGVPKHLYPTFYKDYKMNIYRNNYYIYRLSAEEIVVVYDDISKSIEQQKTISEKEQIIYKTRELEKLRTEFFANISHELKTPLNIILGTIQLNKMIIENGENPINREKLINNINMEKQNCFRLLRLINNLIDSTEIDSKFIELNMVNCNIVNLVEEITQSVAKYINNNISITFDTDLEEKIIACDLDKVGRIILNLLSNSVKFTEPGGSIFVNIIDDKDYITITVKDTGIGIPQNKLNTIFDRFRQVDKSFTRKNEGSGIGLSIVKSLVEMHKGSIFVESKYGIGTKFTIKLPAKVLSNGNIEENRILNNTISNYDEKVRIEFSDIYKLNALSS
ncbi:ATPase, histidine kinase-, DNA gyrase B-, and HSP90-like domain protein [Clostridium carboxidivorans P7]|nr:HAMP domain-containing sensor histidine kinase [Clostridium carboxidivorans]EFG90172.1 ATPase, histidine kinase-, DNA gyrase B-, and HSP90-like domain protein [Clostridium carboxidivorans P7]